MLKKIENYMNQLSKPLKFLMAKVPMSVFLILTLNRRNAKNRLYANLGKRTKNIIPLSLIIIKF